ncbi:TlpA family protein disulfide reductase [Lutibacter sp. A64]|uniref:TlpA family protein disulfide reductase n=1 Tax=Lutibacter sp. A64 TaxID=2918526 RepID=UPI001F0590DD|nr:TlpA disulfide reductase family protein [Lutibacter sp. A64]UMB53931.1 TlpA family protein disulfide reductase [Lutibacter sp. A64]
MNFKKHIVIILIFGLLVNCFKTNKRTENKNISINLYLSDQNDIAFDNSYTNIGAYSYIEKYPKYYSELIKKYSLSNNDSVVIATLFTDFDKFNYDLYKKGIIEKSTIINKKIDTIKESKKINYDQFSIAVYFNNKMRKIIYDQNNNNTFLDDSILKFSQEFNKNGESFKLVNKDLILNYNEINTINLNRKIKIFPALNEAMFRPSKNIKTINSRLTVEFCDYWKGNLIIKKKKYDVAVQGIFNSFLQILIKPSSEKFSNKDYIYNNNFAYKIKDTIKLEKDYFLIDSLANNMSSLYISRTDFKGENLGHRKGQKMKNFKLNDLLGKQFTINEISKDKQFTLLDFWGTWCSPCKELTPKLVKLEKKYSKVISIVGIAYDDSNEKVINYTEEHKMKWTQAFVKRERISSQILKELGIKQYPTFILLDNNQKIIYRSSGKDALIEIEKKFSREE